MKIIVERSGGGASGGVGGGGRGFSRGRDGRLRGVRRGSLVERLGTLCGAEHTPEGGEESVVAEGILYEG